MTNSRHALFLSQLYCVMVLRDYPLTLAMFAAAWFVASLLCLAKERHE